uniref:E3 ubiquitin-protein ligase E3D n=1 Tax=Periophthalmus magnuspinnatus TaxID=409849 RepID=A0A3B4A756_9GOBI
MYVFLNTCVSVKVLFHRTPIKCNLKCYFEIMSYFLLYRKDVSQNPSEAIVTGGESTLHIKAPEVQLSLTLPPGVTFEPGSVIPTSAGDHCEEELHFRLRISTDQSKGKHTHIISISMFQLCPLNLVLIVFRLFQRVLPLPNGNWNAIVDDWCCHPDPFANKKLLPRAEDCLLGDTFLLLARDGSCEHTLTEEISPVCATDKTLKFYITQVVVERCVGDRRSLFLEKTVADKLCELSNSLSTFHFSVQTPDGKPFLLVRTSYFNQRVFKKYISLHYINANMGCKTIIFKVCLLVIMTNWEVNSIGHPLVLPMKVCEELQQLLDESNATLPTSLRCMQSYQWLRLNYD